MLSLLNPPLPLSQLGLQHAPKHLKQHLETGLADGRVVAALAQLVADEGVLCPGELVETKHHAGLAQLEADEVAAGVGHVGVAQAEDEGRLAADPRELVDRVGAVGRGGRRGRVRGGVGAQGARVDVGREVAD